MWEVKYFKFYEEAIKFAESLSHYIYQIILVENGYGVEYKPAKIIDWEE